MVEGEAFGRDRDISLLVARLGNTGGAGFTRVAAAGAGAPSLSLLDWEREHLAP